MEKNKILTEERLISILDIREKRIKKDNDLSFIMFILVYLATFTFGIFVGYIMGLL